MAGFSDYKNALAMRDLLQRLSAEEIAKQRPAYKYATVVSVNASARTANVLIPGDPSEVTIPFGLIAVPEGVGQIVRIDGLLGDRFISDVLTPYVPTLETVRFVGATGQPAFENGWVNFGANGHIDASFYKDPEGVVYLDGLVKNGTAAATVFTLPAGYRPNRELYLIALNNATTCQLRIMPSGTINIASGSPSNAWLSLSGISFVAEDETLGDDLEDNWVTLQEDPTSAWGWNETYDPKYGPAVWMRSDGLCLWRSSVNGAAGAGVTSHIVPSEFLSNKAVLMTVFGRSAPTTGLQAVRFDIHPVNRASPNEVTDNFSLDNIRYFNRKTSADWIACDDLLVNSWVPYGTVDTYDRMETRFHPPGYYKDKYDRVWLRGMIKNGTITSSTTLFTLPDGFRPSARVLITAEGGANVSIRIDVYANGLVRIEQLGAVPTNAYLSLDGVSFRAS